MKDIYAIVAGTVTRVEARRSVELADGRKVNGYVMLGKFDNALALIETTRPHARIEELLTHYASTELWDARSLMRDLLTVEDYRSDIYDAIVRVHYRGEFSV